jgi:hypothetical protein
MHHKKTHTLKRHQIFTYDIDAISPFKPMSAHTQASVQQQQKTASKTSTKTNNIEATEELSRLADETQRKGIEILVPISHKVDNKTRLSSLAEVVENEFAARYLESIKVNVTPANIQKVNERIPLSSCTITRKRVNLQEQYLCIVR